MVKIRDTFIDETKIESIRSRRSTMPMNLMMSRQPSV